MKIVNPAKKTDFIFRELHHFNSRFESVTAIRMKLIDEFQQQVPNSISFSVGYFEKRQQAKLWLVTNDDLKSMYCKYPEGELVLWCDGRTDDDEPHERSGRKRETSKRQEKEGYVEEVYKDLKEKHSDKFDNPKLRLWARMISSNLHDNMEEPPDIPAFSGAPPKRPRKESMTDAITGAAIAFAKTFNDNGKSNAQQSLDSVPVQASPSAGVSPAKAVELRGKNFQQLRSLQQLYDDGILDDKEYSEQKQNILTALRKL